MLALISIILILQLGKTHAASKPNIVFILADDMGWDDIGFHGSEILTPNLDRLAYQGIILDNYYVSPICTPTRGALMTGRYPIHLGLQHGVIAAPEPYGLPLNETTMAQHFKQLGYATHLVGKWHLGYFKTEYTPTFRGFDSHVGYWNGMESYSSHTCESRGYTGLDFRRNMSPNNASGQYSTEYFTSEAEKIINHHDTSKPLFLYLAHQAVHVGNAEEPLEAPQKYIDRFPFIPGKDRRTFAGMVSALDDSVGNVTRTLQQRGMMDNTILVFSTDNGGPAGGKAGSAACNFPLRGAKFTLWEGGVRGNGFIYSPLLKNTGYVSKNLMHITDWLPTLYSAAGGSISQLGNIDGKDMWKMVSFNGESVRDELLHNIDPLEKTFGIRVGEYKLVKGPISNGKYGIWFNCSYPGQDGAQRNSSQKEAWHKLNRFQERNLLQPYLRNPLIVDCGKKPFNVTKDCVPEKAPCLFHIPSDPCEYHNIADDKPEMVADMLRRLDAYMKSSVPPLNKEPDPKANPDLHGGVWSPWMDDI